MFDAATVERINTLSTFLAASQQPPLPDTPDCAFVLAGNAILATCEALFNYLLKWQTTTTLVIAGGIGHSTQLLYDAVERHPRYAMLSASIGGLPEARVIELILRRFWPDLERRVEDGSLTLLIDDESTNCGQNGVFAKRLLDQVGIHPATIVLVQDPTMAIRTAAGLNRVYDPAATAKSPPIVVIWSTFTPLLQVEEDGRFSWSAETLSSVKATRKETGLWTEQRFIDLLLGEVPRLRQYGPSGAGHIAHVDVPEAVVQADEALRATLAGSR